MQRCPICCARVFATSAINPILGKDAQGNPLPIGGMDGNWHQVWNQAIGVAIAWGLAIVGTLVILFVIEKTIGLRLNPEDENEGLDLSQHGEEGYDFNK